MHRSVKKIFLSLGLALFFSGALLVWFAVSFFVNSENLFDAAQNNDLIAVRKLLDSGIPATTTAGDSSTPVLYAAAGHAAGNVEMVTLLLKRGADANQASTEKRTALQAAAGANNVAVMKLLLNHGADVNAATDTPFYNPKAPKGSPFHDVLSYETPLIIAAHFGHAEAVELLLAHGADVNARNSAGRTALEEAKLNTLADYKEVVALLRKSAQSSDRRDAPAPNQTRSGGQATEKNR